MIMPEVIRCVFVLHVALEGFMIMREVIKERGVEDKSTDIVAPMILLILVLRCA